jgi:hypothetical protein
MKVFKIFVDLDKEEKYLRDMAQKGYRFVKYSPWAVYTFKSAEPKPLNYRIDYRHFYFKAQFEEYITLFADAGWEHIYGESTGSQYFIPKHNAEQTEDIFSDRYSKAARHKRIASILCLASFSWLAITFAFIVRRMDSLDAWNAFWLETPLAIFRSGFSVIIPLLLTVVFGYWALKAWRLYKKRK